VEEYKNTLQDYWSSSKPDWTIYGSKNHALHHFRIFLRKMLGTQNEPLATRFSFILGTR